MKDVTKLKAIMEMRAQGKSMEDIGRELDMTRQTVSAYLRTPEAQAIAIELQEILLSTLRNALLCVDTGITEGIKDTSPLVRAAAISTATKIATNLGKIALSQTPQATESREKLTQEDRQALIDKVRTKLLQVDNTKSEG